MFASTARAVPANFIVSASFEASSTSLPLTLTSTPAGRANDNVPFGPFTVTASPATFSSTPFGSAIGFFATLDMMILRLHYRANHFAADALRARLRVGHDAGRRGDDGNAEAAHHFRQRVLATVHAQARTADAADRFDRRLAFEILQRDLELGLGVGQLVDLKVAHIALVLQHLGDGLLGLGCRHAHRRLR